MVDDTALWNRVLTSDERSELYNGGSCLPYDQIDVDPTSMNESVEKSIKFEQVNNVSIFSTSYSNVVTANFSLDRASNVTSNFVFNVIGDLQDSSINCRINVGGAYYDSEITRSTTVDKYGSIYIGTSVFELSAVDRDWETQNSK